MSVLQESLWNFEYSEREIFFYFKLESYMHRCYTIATILHLIHMRYLMK